MNSENTDYKFINTRQLSGHDAVPKLSQGLNRVTLSPDLTELLDSLSHEQGEDARLYALALLTVLQKVSSSGQLSSYIVSGKSWENLRAFAWHLLKNGPPLTPARRKAWMAVWQVLRDVEEQLNEISDHDYWATAEAELVRIVDVSISSMIRRLGDRPTLLDMDMYAISLDDWQAMEKRFFSDI